MQKMSPKNIKILFLEARYFDSFFRQRPNPCLSLYMLAAFLKDNMPEINFEFTFTTSQDYKEQIAGKSYDLCGIYSTTQAWNQACEVATRMKELNIMSIIGGPHISSVPESLTPHFALGCIGPGELVLKRIVQLYIKYDCLPTSEISNMNGVVFYENGKIKIKESSAKIPNLDCLPSPYKYFLKPNRIRTNLISSVGCPHNCYYCSAKVINPFLRFYSAEKLVDEIEFLFKVYKISYFKFIDDNLLASRTRLRNIAKLLEKKKLLNKISIDCTSCSKFINKDTAKLLKLLNVKIVTIGFESGSETVLEKLKCNRITMDDHHRALELLISNHIKVYGNFMVGTPGETIEDVKKTILFIKKNKMSVVAVNFIKPLPGTPFWNHLVTSKKIDQDNVNYQELSLTSCNNKKWYFNDSMSYEEAVHYYNLINRMCLINNIKNNLKNPILYQTIYSQLIQLGSYFMRKIKPKVLI